MKKIIIAGGFLAVTVALAIFIITKTGTTPAPSNTEEPAATNINQAETSSAPAVTITYTDKGFEPSNLSIKSGDTVKVINNSSNSLQFSSDPHPVHTSNSELNEETISAGSSLTFKVTKTGTFGFHDHLDSTKTGKITIE